jgi:PAP2 superfamily
VNPIKPIFASLLSAMVLHAHADVITDWNLKTGEFITEAKIGTPPAARIMAIVQTAAHGAVSGAAKTASVDAAVAAVHRVTLSKLLPAQQAAIDTAYQVALALVADNAAKAAGIAAGEKAAADVLAQRLDDGAAAPESYRPHTTAGAYVPTAATAVPQWPQRKPWMLASSAQFRPAPPPALDSAHWLRDFNEAKDFGGKASARRSAEQTEIARFWEYSLPAIYHGVLRSVALQPGRDVARNARLFALASQAMDDALISTFEAKYHYNFWRPVTAVRNADIDGHDGTQRDASWLPLIDTPMHPEYPSAHSVVASTVAAVIKAELSRGPMPVLSTSSPTAKDATRRWTNVDDFVQEVSDARVWGGIHFRAATEAGQAMGQRIGEQAVQRWLAPQ